MQAKLMTYATDKLDTPSLHFVPIVNLTHGSGKYTQMRGEPGAGRSAHTCC